MRDDDFRKSLVRESNWLIHTLDTIGESAFATDADGQITYLNEFAKQLFNLSDEHLKGKPFYELLAAFEPDENNRLSDLLTLALREGISLTGTERKLVAAHLGKRYVECSATPLVGADGQLQGAIFVLKDVTARREAEDKLRRTESMLHQLFEHSSEVVFRLSPSGVLQELNPYGHELLGVESLSPSSAKSIGEWFDDPRSWSYLTGKMRAHKTIRGFEFDLVTVGGSVCRMLLYMFAEQDEAGKLIAFNGIMHDVTKRQKRQRKVIQDEKMESVSRLAGGIAHDFNNLLTGIIGYSSMTKDAVQPSSQAYQYMTAIEKATRRGIDLTSRLLSLGRIGNRDMRRLQVNRFLQNIVSKMRNQLPEKISLRLDLMESSPVIDADVLQLEQGIVNLIKNSIEAMSDTPGEIILRCRSFEDNIIGPAFNTLPAPLGIVLEVVDVGCGIPREHQDKIFEPFFTTRKSASNVGLGLSLTYGVVQNHRGCLHVESKPGEGTTMRMYLPCLEPGKSDADSSLVSDSSSDSSSGFTVLVIEDEETVRDLACDLLKSRGYNVMTAKDGLEGLEVFGRSHQDVDLVVLDLLMPGPDGTEIFNQLKYIQPETPIVIATGLREVQEVGQLLDSGAAGVILKPFAIKDFLSKIEKVLKKK